MTEELAAWARAEYEAVTSKSRLTEYDQGRASVLLDVVERLNR